LVPRKSHSNLTQLIIFTLLSCFEFLIDITIKKVAKSIQVDWKWSGVEPLLNSLKIVNFTAGISVHEFSAFGTGNFKNI